jgi:four helix bundle protein
MEKGTGNKNHGFRKLHAWQAADDLASEIFRLTENELNPRHRWLGLQIVRAAFSVSANIAEGYGRSSLGDYLRFLEFASGSLNEVEYALHFVKRNGICPTESIAQAEQLRWKSGNLLFGLARSLRSKLKNNQDWQRGLLKEQASEYGTDASDSMFQVPSSKFLDAEA